MARNGVHKNVTKSINATIAYVHCAANTLSTGTFNTPANKKGVSASRKTKVNKPNINWI